jgi:hypothetical protein
MLSNTTEEISENLLNLASNIIVFIDSYNEKIENLTEDEIFKDQLAFYLECADFLIDGEPLETGLSKANFALDNLDEFQPDLTEVLRSLAVLFLEKDNSKKSKKLAIAILESYKDSWNKINEITDKLKPANLESYF